MASEMEDACADFLQDEPAIFIASASPRLRELLQQIGVRFRSLNVSVDEDLKSGEAPEVYVLRLALAKARAGRQMLGRCVRQPVLGADTTVVAEGEILGKPQDEENALMMLARLSGRIHHVYTAIAMVGPEHEASRLCVSAVSFRPISSEEALAYWATGEPRDKAGAYAIQGKGAVFISRLEGSYSGVMGLPVFETAELLSEFGVNILL